MGRNPLNLDREVYKIVRHNLSRLRKEQELTLVELANRTGYSRIFLGNIENGRVGITLDLLEDLANFYGVRTEILFQQHKKLETRRAATAIPGVEGLYVFDTKISTADGTQMYSGANSRLELEIEGEPYIESIQRGRDLPTIIVLAGREQIARFLSTCQPNDLKHYGETFEGLPVSVYYEFKSFKEPLVKGISGRLNI